MPRAKKKTSQSRKRTYSPRAGRKVAEVMHEFKRGTLKGGKGKHPRVKSRSQAIAIGLSEARKAGARVPTKKRRSKKR
jgi:hypothetical protein